ncbi:uncharacterized protein TA04420 [Theileria annulata]|uniref:Uncharacterized protein n=1 Tax=Theileria annulata TaxID=5874 RepID=Q4UCW8_THEAN|nr:uncharacterized protein TA04420 [Theileria annulata]CAI75333.1 hypothetical protein TA04420 [Theileria annulata]|eukprot:XP_954809.1 hypothetical protein TA04420 [Theileria annulata]
MYEINKELEKNKLKKREHIIKEESLPGILNHPVQQGLHGDRDYELEPKDEQKTIITSAITPEDIEFYEELEQKQDKIWKRRIKQNQIFHKELFKIHNNSNSLTNLNNLTNLDLNLNKLNGNGLDGEELDVEDINENYKEFGNTYFSENKIKKILKVNIIPKNINKSIPNTTGTSTVTTNTTGIKEKKEECKSIIEGYSDDD